MYLPIIISRLSNFLFYVQKTNEHNSVKFHLQKYLLGENLNLFFYGESENKIWKQIKELIGEQNTKQIEKAIILSASVFTSYWHKAYKHLSLWERYFQDNQILLQQIIINAKNLIGIKHFAVSKIPVYLISDPKSKDKEINAWFSWTTKKSFIVVEIPFGLRMPNNLFPLSVLAHEFFHLMLRKNKNLFSKICNTVKGNKKLFTKLSEGMPNRIFFEEMLISSFIPEGYLGEKYLNTKVVAYNSKPRYLLAWRKSIAFSLYQTAKEYISNDKQIDKNYIQHIIEVIKQHVE